MKAFDEARRVAENFLTALLREFAVDASGVLQ